MSTGGQLGIATEHIEDFTRVMIDLEKASTDLDADTAAMQLAKFANIMGTDQSLFSNMGSVIAELGNNFATTEAPIVKMAMRITGADKQAGLTEAQVPGLAASLSSVGIQAQAGGSSISKALINMEAATVSGGKALKDFATVSGMTENSVIQEVYQGKTLLNDKMEGDFPVLKPGTNLISWSGGVTRLVVQPNWRYL